MFTRKYPFIIIISKVVHCYTVPIGVGYPADNWWMLNGYSNTVHIRSRTDQEGTTKTQIYVCWALIFLKLSHHRINPIFESE